MKSSYDTQHIWTRTVTSGESDGPCVIATAVQEFILSSRSDGEGPITFYTTDAEAGVVLSDGNGDGTHHYHFMLWDPDDTLVTVMDYEYLQVPRE